jgi:hypothetical protein
MIHVRNLQVDQRNKNSIILNEVSYELLDRIYVAKIKSVPYIQLLYIPHFLLLTLGLTTIITNKRGTE